MCISINTKSNLLHWTALTASRPFSTIVTFALVRLSIASISTLLMLLSSATNIFLPSKLGADNAFFALLIGAKST